MYGALDKAFITAADGRLGGMLPVFPENSSSHPEKKSKGEATGKTRGFCTTTLWGLEQKRPGCVICLQTPHTGRRGVSNTRQDESLKGAQ